MSKSFSADVSQLVGLERDLRDADESVVGEIRGVVARGSLNIKRQWQETWSGHPHMSRTPHTISYDTDVQRDTVTGEIGPDKSRGPQAELAHIFEYGSVNNPPVPGGGPALDAEEPRFERALADLGERLVT